MDQRALKKYNNIICDYEFSDCSMYELLLVGGILPLWIYVGLSLGG